MQATDKKSNCAALAASGACRTDATRMAQQCLSTCAKADVDAVLSAHQPEMRARLSRYIDLPREASRRHERCWLPGWAGHNSFKLMLPTQCAAPRGLPWQRRRTQRQRREGRVEDMLTCPLDTVRPPAYVNACPHSISSHHGVACCVRQARTTPRVPVRTRAYSIPPHTPHEVSHLPPTPPLHASSTRLPLTPALRPQVTVQHVSASPRVRLLHDFITAEEATVRATIACRASSLPACAADE